jgi:hypothetical protein
MSIKQAEQPLDPITSLMLSLDKSFLKEQSHELRSGDLCPQCREGFLEYDGLLNLSCPTCGFAVGGCFT